MIWGIPKSKGGIVIRKTFHFMLVTLFSISILAACAKSTEIVTIPPPTATQVPATKTPLKPTVTQLLATKTLPAPTDTPVMPTQTLEPSPTVSSINGMPMIGRVSVASDGTQGNGLSYAPTISADGRYVAFSSRASNLVEGDTNDVADCFVYDRMTGETTRVSVASDGTQGKSMCYVSSISADGRYVSFKSGSNNLENNTFVHNQMTGETTRISFASDGVEGHSDGAAPAISADGRYVVFNPFYTDYPVGIIVYDRMTGETTLIPVSSDGPGNICCDVRSISADGRYMAFKSGADNLVEGDTNDIVDCFVYDMLTGETTRVSVASDGTQANAPCSYYVMAGISGPIISADGRYVAFESGATNLVEGVTNEGVFVHDRVTGETTFVSVSSDGTQANNGSTIYAISADGRYVAFASGATNLVEGVTNGGVFVHDRVTGKTTLVAVSGSRTSGWNDYFGSSFSADGRYLAFSSDAINLVEGDTNGFPDIFVIDLWASK
jgi:Tol biopolymer transport system component